MRLRTLFALYTLPLPGQHAGDFTVVRTIWWFDNEITQAVLVTNTHAPARCPMAERRDAHDPQRLTDALRRASLLSHRLQQVSVDSVKRTSDSFQHWLKRRQFLRGREYDL